MSYPIGNSSNELVNENPVTVAQRRQSYPFSSLEPGQSFSIPLAEANVRSLRTRCSQLSVNGKRYALRVWEQLSVVEVGRLSDVAQGQANSYSITSNSPQLGEEQKRGPSAGSQQSEPQYQQPSNVGTSPQDFYAPGFNPNNHDWQSRS